MQSITTLTRRRRRRRRTTTTTFKLIDCDARSEKGGEGERARRHYYTITQGDQLTITYLGITLLNCKLTHTKTV